MTSEELQEQYDYLCAEIRKAWRTLDWFRLNHLTNVKAKVLNEWDEARKREIGSGNINNK